MSKIDWDRPLEAYHEDGRVMEVTSVHPWSNEQWPMRGMARGEDIFMGNYGVSRSVYGDMPGWKFRNVTEPKAGIELWAIRRADEILGQADPRDTKAPVAAWIANAFARYIMTKEEAPIDPDLIAAREVVCGYHHDKHPESPWHIEQAEIVRSGRFDNMLDVQAAYHGIKRGRELERGEVK